MSIRMPTRSKPERRYPLTPDDHALADRLLNDLEWMMGFKPRTPWGRWRARRKLLFAIQTGHIMGTFMRLEHLADSDEDAE